MVTRRFVTGPMPRLVLAGAVSAVLASCGGGSGDGTGGGVNGVGDIDDGVLLGNRDVNGDGVLDISFGDIDGDGFEDYDIDGDGNPDTKLGDVDFDGRTDFDVNADGEADFDIDGDGTVDVSVFDDDGFFAGYDVDGNGSADVDSFGDPIVTEPEFIEPSAANPCGSQPDGDPDSDNNLWNDNCQISRVNQFASSQYTRGIQRVVWCSGFEGNSSATTVDAFADGIWGANTQLAVEAFQEAANINGQTSMTSSAAPNAPATAVPVLTGDGVVGPNTWAKLQQALSATPLQQVTLTGSGPWYESYTVPNGRCSTQALFWNEITAVADPLGWTLAASAGSPTRVSFSIDAP